MSPPSSTLPPAFVDVILNIHEMIVQAAEEDKPEPGVFRETEDKLASVVARLDQHAFGRHLFPTVEEKAAILIKELNDQHCFPDGNKRTSLVAMAYYLFWNARPFVNRETEAEMVRRIADPEGDHPATWTEIVQWVRDNSNPVDVPSLANHPRFRRYQGITFNLSVAHTPLEGKDRIAIQAHAHHPKTGRRLSTFPVFQWFAIFARSGKDKRVDPALDPELQVQDPRDEPQNRRSKQRRQAKNKRKRKSRRR